MVVSKQMTQQKGYIQKNTQTHTGFAFCALEKEEKDNNKEDYKYWPNTMSNNLYYCHFTSQTHLLGSLSICPQTHNSSSKLGYGMPQSMYQLLSRTRHNVIVIHCKAHQRDRCMWRYIGHKPCTQNRSSSTWRICRGTSRHRCWFARTHQCRFGSLWQCCSRNCSNWTTRGRCNKRISS